MKFENPSFEIWEQGDTLADMYKHIERCGRVCYKSKPSGKEEDARKFVERMVSNGHLSVLEHGSVYLMAKRNVHPIFHMDAPYCIGRYFGDTCAITTNLRFFVENAILFSEDGSDNWSEVLEKCFVAPTELHVKRVSVKFTSQIAISREFNRHRANSVSEQSTRYCNYSKDKFGGQLTFSKPSWVNEVSLGVNQSGLSKMNEHELYMCAHMVSELVYMEMLNRGLKPEEARCILPLDTQTEFVHTAFVTDWHHFFELRAEETYGKPHPDAFRLASALRDEFKKRGIE